MAQINEKLNELFDSWQSDAHENGENDFVYDGLMNDDNFSDDDWWSSNLRIAFISKDPYFNNSDEMEEGGERSMYIDLEIFNKQSIKSIIIVDAVRPMTKMAKNYVLLGIHVHFP